MKKHRWVVPLLSAIVLFSVTSSAWPQTPPQEPVMQTLVAAGSGCNLGITRLLAKAYMNDHPGITIEIPGSIGSRGAVAAVADGNITFGLLARPLQEKEKSPGLVARPFARVPIVVGVHPTVPEDEITFQEINDIYRGVKTRWKDGSEIIVQAREPTDSGFQVLEQVIPGFREVCAESREVRRWSIYFTDQDANRALAVTQFAIGVTDLGMIATEKLDIKVLKLNGVIPGSESLLDGRYPLSRELLLLYREGKVPEEARAFFDFVRSGEGAKILRANGYVPVN